MLYCLHACQQENHQIPQAEQRLNHQHRDTERMTGIRATVLLPCDHKQAGHMAALRENLISLLCETTLILSDFVKQEVTLKFPCQKTPKSSNSDLKQLSKSSSRYNECCSTALRRPISALPRDTEQEQEREREKVRERERSSGLNFFFFSK